LSGGLGRHRASTQVCFRRPFALFDDPPEGSGSRSGGPTSFDSVPFVLGIAFGPPPRCRFSSLPIRGAGCPSRAVSTHLLAAPVNGSWGACNPVSGPERPQSMSGDPASSVPLVGSQFRGHDAFGRRPCPSQVSRSRSGHHRPRAALRSWLNL
jgi:hypothetical protein